jgi:hypothetical protein
MIDFLDVASLPNSNFKHFRDPTLSPSSRKKPTLLTETDRDSQFPDTTKKKISDTIIKTKWKPSLGAKMRRRHLQPLTLDLASMAVHNLPDRFHKFSAQLKSLSEPTQPC